MKKKALIFGVTGQDGSYLAEILVKKGYKVYGVYRKSATGNLINLSDLISNSKVFNKSFFLLKGDLLDVMSINRIIKEINPHEIYNEADQDHVGWSYEIPNYSIDITATSVVKILEAIKLFNPEIKYFQPCSSNMFGLTKKKFQNEKTQFNPQSIYAIGKVSAFYTINYYRDIYGLRCYSGIFYNHESPRRRIEYVSRKITNTAAKIYLKKQDSISLGDINVTLDWGYAKEYMEAAYKIMQLDKPDDFVVGTGYSYTLKNFLRDTFEYFGMDYKNYLKIDKKLIRPSKTSTLLADNTKLKKAINFKPIFYGKKLVHLLSEYDLQLEK